MNEQEKEINEQEKEIKAKKEAAPTAKDFLEKAENPADKPTSKEEAKAAESKKATDGEFNELAKEQEQKAKEAAKFVGG